MRDYTLPTTKLADLHAAHRQTLDKREADRIKAVILLVTGWAADVAEALLVDANTVRHHVPRYQEGGLASLQQSGYRGSACELSAAELGHVNEHVQRKY